MLPAVVARTYRSVSYVSGPASRPASAIYPPAPWQLRGWGVATVQTVDVRAARRFVPRDCPIVAVAPGRTLGGLLFVSYESGSTLIYRELTIAAALVRVGRRIAFYLPRLYVDSAASLAGGRAIWGVPKEMADFDVATSEGQRTIVVRSGGDDVCRIAAAVPRGGLRLTIPMPAFGTRADSLLFFAGRLAARFALIRAAVELPSDGEFATLALDHPRFAVSIDEFVLRVPVPIALPRLSLAAFVREPAIDAG
jgi:acetoacetate decarboxylase